MLRRHPAFRVLVVVLRLIVGGVLLWAGLAKISEPTLFAQTVRAYEILPIPFIHPFAVFMPWVEVITGLFLIAGVWQHSAALITLLLLLSFLVAIGVNLYRGADLSCGCFGLDGAGGSLSSALVKDVFLILGALILLYPFSFTSWGLLETRSDTPELTESERAELESLSLEMGLPYFLVMGARAILMASEGWAAHEISRKLDVSPQFISGWQSRFAERRVAGLEIPP